MHGINSGAKGFGSSKPGCAKEFVFRTGVLACHGSRLCYDSPNLVLIFTGRCCLRLVSFLLVLESIFIGCLRGFWHGGLCGGVQKLLPSRGLVCFVWVSKFGGDVWLFGIGTSIISNGLYNFLGCVYSCFLQSTVPMEFDL